ncbi:MAG: hypothetical protein PWR01_2536 [Clostridiales bacterium]|jgi:hypothetical protein|nr:hypothetical protein [Clostridiales bacterium]MDN5281463.1 hypothetical protein [Candidatus Ozemobacter sp.]
MQALATISQNRALVCCLGIVLFLSFSGCRQNPDSSPTYYEAEKKAMQKAALLRASDKENKFIKDGYPWEGKLKKVQSLPCSISSVEKPIEHELDYLHTFIHGRKRTKPRLRD